jgi:hypothetical protein
LCSLIRIEYNGKIYTDFLKEDKEENLESFALGKINILGFCVPVQKKKYFII